MPASQTESNISCYECKFYNAEQSMCDRNYEGALILDEEESARECPHYTEGKFIDSDEHLLVD